MLQQTLDIGLPDAWGAGETDRKEHARLRPRRLRPGVIGVWCGQYYGMRVLVPERRRGKSMQEIELSAGTIAYENTAV